MPVIGDIVNTVSNFSLSSQTTSTLLSVAIGILFLTLIWWLSQLNEELRERREIRYAGNTFRTIRKKLKKIKKEKKRAKAAEQAIEKNVSDKPDNKLAEQAEEEAQAETEVEMETTDLVETTTAILADLQNTTNQIQDEVNQKLKIAETEKLQSMKVEALNKQLRNLNKYSDIDQKTARFLHDIFSSFSEQLKQQVLFEEQNEEHHKNFVKHLYKSIKDLFPISEHALKELRKLRSKEKKERRTFEKEIKMLKRTIKDKEDQLKEERRKGEQADPILLAELQKEISLMVKNYGALEKMQAQVKQAHQILYLEIKKLQEILGQVLKAARSQRNFRKKLKPREKELSHRHSQLKKHQQNIESTIENFWKTQKIHGLVLDFSKQINDYFEFYLKVLEQDIEVEEEIKRFLTGNIVIERKMESFTQLLISLEESEQALEQGTGAIVSLISVIMTQDVSGSLRKQAQIIRKESKVLDDEKRVEKVLVALDQEIQERTMFTIKNIDQLIDKEKNLLAETESTQRDESKNLGKSMATMIDRKISIDQKYARQARKFGDQLEKRNQQAAAAYQKAA